MQKLTDIWQNLVRWHDRPDTGQRDNEQDDINQQEMSQLDVDQGPNEELIDEQQYKNMYWTGVVSMQGGMEDRISR